MTAVDEQYRLLVKVEQAYAQFLAANQALRADSPRLDAQSSIIDLRDELRTFGQAYKELGLPILNAFAGNILRELDVHDLLGGAVIVAGPVAQAAYALEDLERYDTATALSWKPIESLDLVFTNDGTGQVMAALKRLDRTFNFDNANASTAVNKSGFVVTMTPGSGSAAEGVRLRRVLFGADGLPAPAVTR